jgi:integrase
MFLAAREAQEPPIQPATIYRYGRDLTGFADWIEANGHPTVITEIQGKDGGKLISAFLVDLRQHGKKDTTRRTIYLTLLAFWNWAEEESAGNRGEPGVNPPYVFRAATRGLKVPPDRPSDHVTQIYTDAEVDRMLEHAGHRKSASLWQRRNRMIVQTLYHTGMRRQELARLRVSDYRADGGIDLRRSTTKTKRARTVYVYNGIKVELDSFIMILKHEGRGDDDDPLFPSERARTIQKGDPEYDPSDPDRQTYQLRADGVGNIMSRIIAGVQADCSDGAKHKSRQGCSQCIRFSGCHRFRHTWKARASASGMTDDSQMELGGWKNHQSMDRYGTGDRPRQSQVEAKRMADASR